MARVCQNVSAPRASLPSDRFPYPFPAPHTENRVTNDELGRFRQWARDQIAGGTEPPWALYRYMQLDDALTAILEGRAATREHGGLHLVGVDEVPETPKPKMPV